ncbi:DUF4352 domain-containing protein [Nonomuraea sp. NPDC026600]|uniref:DUF4352 domain-containing protein n=1 Tax=Nonomuraea sp. NPDC026600 TaxID=3155363 RepID=UPI00340486FA
MGYPQQPQDPYGQSGPQQPYGYGGPPPQYGYGYQPPTSPPPPPRRNVGLIVLLAVGLPLMLLGGCAALVVVLGDTGRDVVVTEADSPNMVLPSREPASKQPTEEATAEAAKKEPSTAAVGGSITLQGTDPGLKMTVTVNQLVNPASPAQDFLKPKSGNKFVAVQVTLANVGQAVYSDAPGNGAMLIDGEGQQYRSTIYEVREGQAFGGSATINADDSRKGMIVFEVPESAKLVKFQFALNSGFADQKGEWTLN